MWHEMVSIEIPAWGKVIRTIVVYAGLAILLRLAGKRDLAQLNTFDLVVVLLLANVLQNAVIGDDYSLLGGLLGAAVLNGVNAAWVRIAASSDALSRWTEGRPTVLVRDGQIVAKPSRSGLRHADILVALRRQGAHSLEDVERATLTPRGSIVVDLRPGPARPPPTICTWRTRPSWPASGNAWTTGSTASTVESTSWPPHCASSAADRGATRGMAAALREQRG